MSTEKLSPGFNVVDDASNCNSKLSSAAYDFGAIIVNAIHKIVIITANFIRFICIPPLNMYPPQVGRSNAPFTILHPRTNHHQL